MSYEVSVFEWTAPEEPPSFGAVQEIVKIKEGERQPSRNPKFAALAQALLRQFPNGLMMNNADPGRDDAVEWPDDPAASAANADVGVWRVYLPGQQRLAVLKALVEHAEGLGLAVLDEQIPLAWLPSGRMLPEIAGEAWVEACNEVEMPTVEPSDPPLKLSEARKQMVAELRKVLVSKGWTITPPKDYEADIHAWREGGVAAAAHRKCI